MERDRSALTDAHPLSERPGTPDPRRTLHIRGARLLCHRSSRDGVGHAFACVGDEARLRRRLPDGAALASAIPFSLWHAIVVFHTVGQTSLAQSGIGWIVGCTGGFAAVFIGGVLFARLRLATGNLACSFVAHWGFNAVILIGLYLLR